MGAQHECPYPGLMYNKCIICFTLLTQWLAGSNPYCQPHSLEYLQSMFLDTKNILWAMGPVILSLNLYKGTMDFLPSLAQLLWTHQVCKWLCQLSRPVFNTQYYKYDHRLPGQNGIYGWNFSISGLKIMSKCGLEKMFLKFLHVLTMSFLLLNLYFWSKLLLSMR